MDPSLLFSRTQVISIKKIDFNLVLGFLQCELEIDNIFCYTIMQDLIMLQKKHPQISLAKLLHNHDLIYLREGITEHSVPP